MNFFKRIRWVYLLLSLVLIAAGVCLIMMPELSMETACMAAGIATIVYGFLKIVIYFVREVEQMVEQYDFSVGLLCIGAGALLVLHPGDVLRLIPQVVSFYIMGDCIFKLQVSLDAKRLGSFAWFLMLLTTLLVGAWGACLLLQPLGLDAYASFLLAGGLIADGVMNLLAVIFIAAVVRKPAAEGGPVPKVPDLTPVPVPATTVTIPAPKYIPEEDEEPVPQVKDLLEASREKSNPPESKSGMFSFFRKKKEEMASDDIPVSDFSAHESEDEV